MFYESWSFMCRFFHFNQRCTCLIYEKKYLEKLDLLLYRNSNIELRKWISMHFNICVHLYNLWTKMECMLVHTQHCWTILHNTNLPAHHFEYKIYQLKFQIFLICSFTRCYILRYVYFNSYLMDTKKLRDNWICAT